MDIKDFGQKIGGARKDLLSKGTADIGDWTADEQRQLVIRDNIWKKPNYQKMKDNGLPIEVVAKIKMIRDAIPTRPTFVTPQTYYDITVFIKKTTDEVREFEDFGKLSTYLAQYTECWFHYDFSKVESAVETDLHAVKVFIKENKSIYQYMLQLREMGENPEEYNSIWNYTEGETEPRFPLYNYPDAGFKITETYSNLGMEQE